MQSHSCSWNGSTTALFYCQNGKDCRSYFDVVASKLASPMLHNFVLSKLLNHTGQSLINPGLNKLELMYVPDSALLHELCITIRRQLNAHLCLSRILASGVGMGDRTAVLGTFFNNSFPSMFACTLSTNW